jgi:phosphoribosyl-AMP cyclohydrolase / phosphoribosyl-ATP pyrophosphohydrolase
VTSGGRNGAELEFLGVLEEIIDSRITTRPSGSYVARLVAEGDRRVAQKLGEEALELALAAAAGSKDQQLEEAADLVFHLLILLRSKALRLADVAAILERRHRLNVPESTAKTAD